jgi:ADP-ribose pyrophosphatase
MPAEDDPEAAAEVDYSHRLPVPDETRAWDVDQPDYDPPRFTTEWVHTIGVERGVSDPDNPAEVDFSTRPSFCEGGYTFDEQGRPLNPMGRQGIGDRGDLSKWGPNQAEDAVVIAVNDTTGNRKILLVRRADTRQWALPGGMVDPGEKGITARRELQEETGVDLAEIPGRVIYQGYVDDPRNTDNAWMETTARRFLIGYTPDAAGADDAADARWFNANSITELRADIARTDEALGEPPRPVYASHEQIVGIAVTDEPSDNRQS